jgi:hypothetical protein
VLVRSEHPKEEERSRSIGRGRKEGLVDESSEKTTTTKTTTVRLAG